MGRRLPTCTALRILPRFLSAHLVDYDKSPQRRSEHTVFSEFVLDVVRKSFDNVTSLSEDNRSTNQSIAKIEKATFGMCESPISGIILRNNF